MTFLIDYKNLSKLKELAKNELETRKRKVEILSSLVNKGSDSEFRLLDERLQLIESQKRYDVTVRQFEFASVKATVTGTVSKVDAVNLGQHIQQGNLLAEIVPENDKLKIRGQVNPKDIAYVKVNQKASVGFSAYDQAVFGKMEGIVTKVAANTTQERGDEMPFYPIIIEISEEELERAAKINNSDDIAQLMNDLPESLKGKVKGGGSLTALPIIETQAGDVSAYIPTNVISITDGQIFLEANLFNAGIRPAINVGISVSRVGGSAQIKSMKKVSGTLKLDQAQYRELEAFSKFGSDLDPATMAVLERGARNVEILKQNEGSPMPVEEQVAIIYCGSTGILTGIPTAKIKDFEENFLDLMRTKHRKVLDTLKAGKLTEEVTDLIKKVVAEMSKNYEA